MKILWVNANFLHPTTKGGHIRTLGMVRELHKRHEIHYVAFASPSPEALARAGEYCTKAYAIPHKVPNRRSPAFFANLIGNLFTSKPLTVFRYHSPEMARTIAGLRAREAFDAIVCDFLFPVPNLEHLEECVLFQHNVETTILRRHAETETNPLSKAYFSLQAERLFRYEREICRTVKHTVAVSAIDAEKMRTMFGITNVSDVKTGVDVDFFTPRGEAKPVADLVFVGSMDWMPNIDGIAYFTQEILPLIRAQKPDCSVAIVGRTPPPEIVKLGETDPKVIITGTVPEVRPYLWGSKVSIVPLRVGSGTRLKIYESMAARTAVVSTTIGAEGLDINPPHDIRMADTPADFARECIHLLNDAEDRERVAAAGWKLVSERFSWEQVTREFESILAASSERITSPP